VFRSLSSFRDSWRPEEEAATSGVFRILSEDGPSTSTQNLTATTLHVSPSEGTSRIETVVTTQSECQKKHSTKPRISTELPNKLHISGNKDSRTNAMADKTSGDQTPDSCAKRTELSKRIDVKEFVSSEGNRGDSEPSGDTAQHELHPPRSVSEKLESNSCTYIKLESSSTSSGEHQGMHPAARDTGQQRGASPLSRASSPGTNSSSGSFYNFSSTTEATADSRGLRTTPMGSTTGLLPDNSCSSHSKLHVSTHFAERLTLSTLHTRYID
jgi:hypothetical protein